MELPFCFDRESIDAKSLLVTVPKGIETKDKLIEALDEQLKLPDYFGFNWDALEECLCDLEWVHEFQIVIMHEDLPLSKNTLVLKIYLDILKKVVIFCKSSSQHEVIIVFPGDVKTKVQCLLV